MNIKQTDYPENSDSQSSRIQQAVETIRHETAQIKEIIDNVKSVDLHRAVYQFYDDDEKTRTIIQETTQKKYAVLGYGGSAGIGIGSLAMDADTAERWAKIEKRKVIFVRPFYKPDDVHGILASVGVIASEGSATSHGAVVARQFGVPAVVGCSRLRVDLDQRKCAIDGITVHEGDTVIVDGGTGTVFFDLESKGSQKLLFTDEQFLSAGVVRVFNNYICQNIRSRNIPAKGVDLATYVLLTIIEQREKIEELPEFATDWEYIHEIYIQTSKEDLTLTLILPLLKELFGKIGVLVATTKPNELKALYQETLVNLNRIEQIANQAVLNRHLMFVLQKAIRKLDQSVSLFYEQAQITDSHILGPRILMVDDEPYMLQEIMDTLERALKAEILIASTVEESIQILEGEAPIDLLICDIYILSDNEESYENPAMGGLRVCQKARDTRGADLPIICLTVVTDNDIWHDFRKLGVDMRINKLNKASEIVPLVRDLLERQRNKSQTDLAQAQIRQRKLELKSSDMQMRLRALWALYQLSKYDASLFSFIENLAENDREQKVRTTAKGIVAKFKDADAFPSAPRYSLSENSTSEEQTRKEVTIPTEVDVLILTILPEEYEAVWQKLKNPSRALPNSEHANLYAWKVGFVPCNGTAYTVAVGMIFRPGTIESALATRDGVERWNPRYILLVGVAGGLKNLAKGDVVIANIIHGYEYGKLEKTFQPRSDWTYRTDIGLLTSAVAHAATDWQTYISAIPPVPSSVSAIAGEIASGDKVVDDPSSKFFASVLKYWPKIIAVEMEGAGAGDAVEQTQALGKPVSYMMIRGISDISRSLPSEAESDELHGTKERDAWKKYAADTAAAFTISFLASGLPLPPRQAAPGKD